MIETECVACKYSGTDEQQYRARGCPACTCETIWMAQAEENTRAFFTSAGKLEHKIYDLGAKKNKTPSDLTEGIC